MKLNESNLADPLLLTGCALSGPPWGSGGPFGGQDLISTTTFPDDNLLLPATPSSGANSTLSCKGSSPNAPTGVELDALLIVQSSDSFAELKPLPPFEYAANPGTQLTLHNDPHLPQMGSSTSSHPSPTNSSGTNSSNATNGPNATSNGTNANSHSSSGHIRAASSASGSSLVNSPNGTNFSSPSVGGSPSSLFDVVSSSTSVPANIKSELADYLMNSDIDDIAALIGNAIADSTVPNLGIELDPNGVTSSTIDPWTELDAWIESACQQQPQQQQNANQRATANLLDQDATIHTSGAEQSNFLDGNPSTLQTLLEADSFSGNQATEISFHPEIKQEFHHTSILQSRLQQPIPGNLLRVTSNGGPNTSPSQLPESTTPYGLKVDPYTLDPGSPTFIDPITGEVTQRPHTTHVSPPVVTSTIMNGPNGAANSKYRKQYKLSSKSSNGSFPDGTSFVTPFGNFDPHGGIGNQQSKLGIKTKRKSSKLPSSSGVGTELDPCGKEKPIHRCGICNRGFLNKSNIKVHLRTHTGEKPFKCEVCGKAFRQKAHLLKHIQIHKRIQRD